METVLWLLLHLACFVYPLMSVAVIWSAYVTCRFYGNTSLANEPRGDGIRGEGGCRASSSFPREKPGISHF
jgi:hypothetical protein